MSDVATIIIHGGGSVSIDEGEGLIEFLNRLGQPGKKAGVGTIPPDYTVTFVIGNYRYTYAAGRWTRTRV